MIHRIPAPFAILLALACLMPLVARAQTPPPATPYSQDQLDALLAPIALYPDQLLAQVLMAATYPLDVVAAARFVKANPDLKGDALDQAVAGQSWDPSVQSLAGFPQVLVMMSDKLDWTQQLGDAFLADEAAVMRTVQLLRTKAEAAGNLKSSEQQKVVVQQSTIIIEPAQPQVVYVPVYNPLYVYGPWWAPAYRPWYWAPPRMYYPAAPPSSAARSASASAGRSGAITGAGARPNWGGNNINININNNAFINRHPNYRNSVNNGNWQHRPEQRKGVAYRDAATRDHYRKVDNSAVAARRDYRGNPSGAAGGGQRPSTMDRPGTGGTQRPSTMDRPGTGGTQRPSTMDRPGTGGTQRPSTMDRPGTGGAQRPTTMDRPGSVSSGRPIDRTSRPSPSFNASQSRPQAQQYSNRGAQSRSTMSSSRGGGGGRPAGGGGRGGGGGGRGR